MVDFIVQGLYTIALWLDDIVYSAVSALYNIFIAFTSMNVIEAFPELISVGKRIMLLAGLFMLFVVAFSLIQYLLDPDKAKNSKDGASVIVKNIFIAIAMIAVVNPIFNFMYEVQSTVVKDQLVERIVLGADDVAGSTSSPELIGQQMALMSWISFFNEVDETTGGAGKSCGNKDADCGEDFDEYLGYGIISQTNAWQLAGFVVDDVVIYSALFSTAAGIFLVIILLSFTIDVGVRMFKLLIYQVLSPIAIFAFINPKSQGVFNSWIKSVLSTYVDLFIRILAIFFAIILISNIGTLMWGNDGADSLDPLRELTGFSESLAFFLLMVAIFIFAKTIPKLIGDLFGVKLGDSINPFKKAGFAAALGGILGGITGAIGGGIAGALATDGSNSGVKGGVYGTGRTIKGAFMGGLGGVNSGRKAKGLTGIVGQSNKNLQNQFSKAKDKREGAKNSTQKAKDKIKDFMDAPENVRKKALESNTKEKYGKISSLANEAKGIRNGIAAKDIAKDLKKTGHIIDPKEINTKEDLKKWWTDSSVKRRDYLIQHNASAEEIDKISNEIINKNAAIDDLFADKNAELDTQIRNGNLSSDYKEEYENLQIKESQMQQLAGEIGYTDELNNILSSSDADGKRYESITKSSEQKSRDIERELSS